MNETTAPSGNLEPHRGSLILVFGILALVVCGIVFGLIAWVMGKSDLEQMKAGTMDRQGESLTQVGKILGIVGLVKDLIAILLFILIFIGSFALSAAQVQHPQ